jgi:hypothetical protein
MFAEPMRVQVVLSKRMYHGETNLCHAEGIPLPISSRETLMTPLKLEWH